MLPKPERRLARQAGRSALLTQADGRLYPLYTETRTFDRFGTDVSQYFHLMFHSKSFFMFLFVINLSNIIVNIEGMGQSFSWFTVHTLGNTARDGVLAKGGHSYAVMEFLTAGCLVAYLFFIRGADAARPALTPTLARTAHPNPNPDRKPSPWRQPQASSPSPSPHPNPQASAREPSPTPTQARWRRFTTACAAAATSASSQRPTSLSWLGLGLGLALTLTLTLTLTPTLTLTQVGNVPSSWGSARGEPPH